MSNMEFDKITEFVLEGKKYFMVPEDAFTELVSQCH